MTSNEDSDENVDVVREQERRARLQLLDEIREPSPQPIFGEPVKVELEDETSRRIKNTLGDFTQVLNDKTLLGISRTTSSTSGHASAQSGRNSSAAKRPPTVNGMYKLSTASNLKHPVVDKRPGYPRNKPHDSINCPTTIHSDTRSKDQPQWDKFHSRNMGAPPSLNGANPSCVSFNPSLCPAPSNLPSNKTYPFHGRNGTVSNATVLAPRTGESSSSAPPPKRCFFRPATIKLPERRPEKPVESPKRDQDLETILREMKQAVPPPLTAIQTPRTEESGFPFPDVPKEEVPSNSFQDKKNNFTMDNPEVVPQPPEPPKLKEGNSRQNTPSPCISSSLQEDLEMSDSDDEIEVISEVKSNDAKNNVDNSAAEYPKSSPLNSSGVTSVISSTAVNNSTMDVPQSVPSSSSSESGDSDSDDSSSESNDSDSSASSEASDADTPSKMWGLSNFFDETRRNHSPAFVPMDTSTNSSTTAIKEEPVAVRQDPRESYSLVDDDSVNGGLRDHITDPIPNFLELDSSVNIKREILSPITSPLHQAGPSSLQLPPPPPPPPPPPAPNPQTIRGPRTPPSPEYSVTVESVDINRNSVSSGNVKSDNAINVEITVPQSQTIKHSGIQQISCDMKEETGKVQTTIVKKRLSKNKTEIFSPRTDSSPVTQSFEDDEPSASKGLPDVSSDKDENGIDVLTSSYSVPSETSESSHDNYSIKTRQKVSKSSSTKKTKAVIEEVPNLNCQKGNNLSKSSGSKTKHPVRTCRTSSDAKQLSKTVKSSKSDQSEETKRPIVKPDLKEKSSSEKNKNSSRSGSNAKAVSKNSVKIKKKPSKLPPKPATEGKKDEVKKKKSKFHIQNFLQSPTVSQSESLILKVSVHSPSCDRSPIPDYKKSAEKRKRSISPTCGSRSPSRSSSKSIDRVKCEKLRRSTRCSERASSIAQAESSTATNQDSDVAKKSSKRTPKRREHVESSPVHVEAPPLLLSPIPHNSPIPVTLSECAIPTKILVSIPLDKISRLPSSVRVLSSEIKPISKRSQQPVDENIQKKDSVLSEKSSKNTSSKYSSSKDIKYKPRTDLDSKASKNSKSALVSKKDKNSKALSESSSVKTKTTSSVNSKNSIKTAENKQSSGASENKVSKKRKSEGEIKQPVKKKSKTYLEVNQDRSQLPSARTESPNNLIACTSKSKGLERCDSVSSLSSLGSQVSQRSSKEKRNSSASEAKREKLSVPLKHVIKQEKEEKVKATIKKEPGTPDKNKDVGRDKLLSKDADCSEKKVETTWNDTSSQYSPWEDSCKDDSKGLPIPTPLSDSMNRICALEWDSLEMKNVKEASNLKHTNLPIMPMDYYYMEGRKQRHLAEKEKDPFVQTLKFFEATVLFILTSQQREEYTKEPESVYQFYRETLNFSNLILENVRLQQCSPGSMEFKVLVLLLRCQALLHVKLYNLKLKEIKEQQKHVSEFFLGHCQATVQSLTHPIPSNPRMNLISIPSPHSPAPSPASSVNSQTSGYSSSDVSSCHRNLSHFAPSVTIARNMLETICRQHTHLTNLHMGHDLWEQADMYMTRSNLREFFKEVADLSENLTLHSSIKDLVNYVQTGISLVKKCCR